MNRGLLALIVELIKATALNKSFF